MSTFVDFDSSVTEQSVEIVINDDMVVEGDESFAVNLEYATEIGPETVILNPQIESVIITDNDGKAACAIYKL